MLETRSRKARLTQEEMTRWTSVRSAKARANKAKASTARAMAKRSKDSKDNKDRTRLEGELPEIGIDYAFFGRDREGVLPILCVKCRNSSTGCPGATVVDRKGASDCASAFLTAFIKSSGFKRILVRSANDDHC